nr:immunoglobulin heavy chain junction region [Macaca mulatta]MOV40069.1 immunoglobulin heavy chain junction region [Macaca mulatta]MOV41101.1 immunoglobulin heavy chain junction region [Macaca mulatta]MOV42160.1 immunoglobulin heavy chain junction region [Macaca mulatta]MOV42398.1 immunoglobulin heavy chain junction region [Macaca mulatta]
CTRAPSAYSFGYDYW